MLHAMCDANFLRDHALLVEDCVAKTNRAFCRPATLLNVRQMFGLHFRSADIIEALA